MWGNMDESISGNAGGFMDDSTAGPEQSTQKKQINVVPLFINHLLISKGEIVKFGDIFARSIALLARVIDIEQTATKNTYTLEDDTGTILAMQWLEVGKSVDNSELKKDMYVRVIGHLRETAGKKHLLIQEIRPLTTMNELTAHFLEVLHMFIMIRQTRLGLNGTKSNAASKAANSASGGNMDVENGQKGEGTAGLNKAQALVFKAIQAENDSENGIEREVLKSRMPKSILANVNEIIDFLISEGHIYSTLSDDYFKTT